jgi:hypothetical protein
MKEVIYLRPPYTSLQEAALANDPWSPSRADLMASCPRKAEYHLVERLMPRSPEPLYLRAGSAMHAALAAWHLTGSREQAMAELARVWGDADTLPRPEGDSYGHLTLGALEVILTNYTVFAAKQDTFRPLLVKLGDLNLKHVIAATWALTDDDLVVLSECRLLMEFDVDGERLVIAGRPDLPIRAGGNTMILDHKVTSEYLGPYFFGRFRLSTQLRTYAVMLDALLGQTPAGAVINGIYVGRKAVESTFQGTRFLRHGPIFFTAGHLQEALENILGWKRALADYQARRYFPQHTSTACRSCQFLSLCTASPMIRPSVKETEYMPRPDITFFDY